MGQIIRCPLVGAPCMKPITVQEKTFFLAEAEEPEDATTLSRPGYVLVASDACGAILVSALAGEPLVRGKV